MTDLTAKRDVEGAPVVTVVVLTYNGERYLDDLLAAVFVQDLSDPFEVLVIDSGSTDGTLEIIAKYPSVRLVEIPNGEFGHGRTRNLGAQLATGEFVAFLTHDAIPAHSKWLYELLKPFEMNSSVVAVMGKQLPRPSAFPLLKYEIQDVFSGFGPDFGTTYFYNDYFAQSRGVRDAISFYSDVNSAARRETLLDAVPYRDVSYAEDQMFGRDVLAAGYVKSYAPRASVVHSNDMTLSEYDNRMFDETVGLRQVGIEVDVPSWKVIARLFARNVMRDSRRILRDRDYRWRRKLYWLAVNPAFHAQKWRGVRSGARASLDNLGSHRAKSLEAMRKGAVSQ